MIQTYSIVIFILAVVIGLSAMAGKIKLPYPVFLVMAGIAVGFIPGTPKMEIDPEIIFLVFLPPLLYDGAFNISMTEFRNQFHTISGLSMALVFFTTVGIAVVAHYLIPGMSWPVSFVLGAILSATDAVAAMGITKGLGIPHKIATILEGESLINDASGLIAYRLALAAVAGASFVMWKAWLQFLLLIVGGGVVGFVLGKLLGLILKAVRNDNMVSISFTLLAPFVAYLMAEELQVSGVIAVVVIGMMTSFYTREVLPDKTREQARSIWDIVVFLLNGLIFILIGLEFPHVLKNIPTDSILPLVGYSFLICLVALVIRMGRIFLQHINLQRAFNKRKFNPNALLDWKSCLVIGWSGMRGIVSLATAFALPATLADGSVFPQRDSIVFISVAVVLITIIFQGLTLPMLVKSLKLDEPAKQTSLNLKS